MSSTNKTSHYNLSQYIGTDKPTYLVDYNGDMEKIDAGIYASKSEADTNALAIGDLTNLTTDSKSTLVGAINEVDAHTDTNTTNIGTNTTNIATNTTNIGVMANLETTVKSSLVGAINEVKTNINNFNLSDYTVFDNTGATPSIISDDASLTGSPAPAVTVAKNSDGSLAKVYGFISMQTNKTGAIKVTVKDTGLTPSSEFTIQNAGIIVRTETTGQSVSTCNLVFKTNGDIEITLSASLSAQWINIHLLPILYYIKDFGDTPIII